MKPIKFKEVNVEIAKDQPEYITLPAYVDKESSTFCFQLSKEEQQAIVQFNRLKSTTSQNSNGASNDGQSLYF